LFQSIFRRIAFVKFFFTLRTICAENGGFPEYGLKQACSMLSLEQAKQGFPFYARAR